MQCHLQNASSVAADWNVPPAGLTHRAFAITKCGCGRHISALSPLAAKRRKAVTACNVFLDTGKVHHQRAQLPKTIHAMRIAGRRRGGMDRDGSLGPQVR